MSRRGPVELVLLMHHVRKDEMKKKLRSIALLSCLLSCLLAVGAEAGPATAKSVDPKNSPATGGEQRFVTLDFNDVDINTFIKYISELTKKNFIVDREVKGKVTIISPTRISAEREGRGFLNPVRAGILRWLTCWLLCLPLRL